jgi:trimeric autotransporter adhesin
MGYSKYFAILLAIIVILIMPAMAFTPVAPIIDYGATVFIGEEGLNMSLITGPTPAQFGFWGSSNPLTTSPIKTLSLGPNMVEITDSEFYGYTGTWYKIVGDVKTAAFIVADPRLDMAVITTDQITNLNGKTVSPGQAVSFRVNNNFYYFTNRYDTNASGVLLPPNTNNGFVNIKVGSPDGGSYSKLIASNGSAMSVQDIFLNNNPYFWASQWDTGAKNSNGQKIYSSGIYNIYAESTLNGMNDNIVGNRTGRTISPTYTLTIGSTAVKITANTDSIMKNKAFSVTIIGTPRAYYNLWVKDTNQMVAGIDSQPPAISFYQDGVNTSDPITANYTYQDGNGKTVAQNTPSTIPNQSYYANVSMSSDGSRIVSFETGSYTKSGRYTIRVEQKEGNNYKGDEILIVIESGSITIVAKDYQSFYLGEVIKLQGTNSVSQTTYLFMTGPNLPTQGAQIGSPDPRNYPVINGDVNTFEAIDVDAGNWNWDWNTGGISLDSGTYTVYAVSTPSDRNNLQSNNYATLAITIKKPFISATVSQPSVAKGDKLFIRGVAEGNPPEGVAIWIIGTNYAERAVQTVNSGSLFEYEITGAITEGLTSGQYFVVVQHPMQNGEFDVYLDSNGYVYNRQLNANTTSGTGTSIFRLTGPGSLQGSDAAEALIRALDDQNIDDTYTRLQFLIDQPYIRIVPIGNKQIGDKFTITSSTNLAVDDEINVEIYSSSFKPTEKSVSGEFSGATGTVKVAKGDVANKIIFEVDTSTFKEDEYIVMETAITVDASGSSVFDVQGMAVPTTITPSQSNVTVKNITLPTPVPTPIPTPTPAPTNKPLPGFGTLLALSGIIIVGIIIVKRETT